MCVVEVPCSRLCTDVNPSFCTRIAALCDATTGMSFLQRMWQVHNTSEQLNPICTEWQQCILSAAGKKFFKTIVCFRMLFIVGKSQQLNAHPWIKQLGPPSMTKSPWPGDYISDVELENLSVSVITCYCGVDEQFYKWTKHVTTDPIT